jgi:hypothetical protein
MEGRYDGKKTKSKIRPNGETAVEQRRHTISMQVDRMEREQPVH